MHCEHSELGKEIVAFNFFLVVNPDTAVTKLKYYAGCTECERNLLPQQWEQFSHKYNF